MAVIISYAMLFAVLVTVTVAMRPWSGRPSVPTAQGSQAKLEQRGVSVGPIAGMLSLVIALVGAPDVLVPIGISAFLVAALAAPTMLLRGVVNVASKQPAEQAFWSAFASLSLAAAAFAAARATGVSV